MLTLNCIIQHVAIKREKAGYILYELEEIDQKVKVEEDTFFFISPSFIL